MIWLIECFILPIIVQPLHDHTLGFYTQDHDISLLMPSKYFRSQIHNSLFLSLFQESFILIETRMC